MFKNGEPQDDPLYIHRQSCYLLGRDRKIADLPVDHPSCSKQHAVLQVPIPLLPSYDAALYVRCGLGVCPKRAW